MKAKTKSVRKFKNCSLVKEWWDGVTGWNGWGRILLVVCTVGPVLSGHPRGMVYRFQRLGVSQKTIYNAVIDH